MLNNRSIPSDVKGYYEFFTFFSLHQLIKVPTHVTFNSAIIDYILAKYTERVTQQGIIDLGKIFRIERGTHKNINFRSFKHYSADLFNPNLGERQ